MIEHLNTFAWLAYFYQINKTKMFQKGHVNLTFSYLQYLTCFHFLLNKLRMIFAAKYTISSPLMIEKPVRRPMVPPTPASMSVNLTRLSLVIMSKMMVSK